MSCDCDGFLAGTDPCNNPVDPCVCGAVPDLPIQVSGVPGANGKSAYELWLAAGNVGTEADYLASLVGEQGPPGVAGLTGPRGAPSTVTGVPGANGVSTPIAFFTGAQFSAGADIGNAADALSNLTDARELSLGQIPFVSGRYLIRAQVQLGWTGDVNTDLNGNCWLVQSENSGNPRGNAMDLIQWDWARLKRGVSGYNYGTVQSYDLDSIADLVQGYYLRFAAGGDFYLAGGNLTVFALPQYVVSSPGFTDGLYQRTFNVA